VAGVIKDAFTLWLNQHPEAGDQITSRAIHNAHKSGSSLAQSANFPGNIGPPLYFYRLTFLCFLILF
jgi:topoisomerase-4 subunit B